MPGCAGPHLLRTRFEQGETANRTTGRPGASDYALGKKAGDDALGRAHCEPVARREVDPISLNRSR